MITGYFGVGLIPTFDERLVEPTDDSRFSPDTRNRDSIRRLFDALEVLTPSEDGPMDHRPGIVSGL
jgi:hypothetical protein